MVPSDWPLFGDNRLPLAVQEFNQETRLVALLRRLAERISNRERNLESREVFVDAELIPSIGNPDRLSRLRTNH